MIDSIPSIVKPSVATDTSARDRIGVMLLISSLEHGGAERQVVELVRAMDRTRFDPVICSLSDIVPLADCLDDSARDLVVVEKKWKYDTSTIRRVAEVMRDRRVRIVHAFLFDAEMVARLAARRAGVEVVISSERNTDYSRPIVHTVCLKATANRSTALIANSHSGKRFVMRTMGLRDERVFVVHNGVDVVRFSPGDGRKVRSELGIGNDDFVVGMVASFKRQKNHGVFFRMAEVVARRFPNAWFMCVGEPLRDNQQGAGDYHKEVRAMLSRMGIRGRFLFPGNRNDMPDVYNACDVTMLTSTREGTPNVLLESMACGVPVVATDVADNAYVVRHNETGYVVPLGDVESLADRVAGLLADADLRGRMGVAARAWVEREFSTSAMARRTEAIYVDLLGRVASGGS
jgi:glycosyltransferase involved in cell wall biosynthesis